ncbi:MAG: DUF1385 domain-containing protein [candidate division Zixibacteria bacterium]|nr:DUF1385 domain-containing protein [candidate division Zixibacteria bacterium]
MPDLSVGGQAVIEGVMMRSKDRVATAVRISTGEILVKSEESISLTKKYKILAWPVLRGIITFFEMLIIGIRTLNFSADIAVKEIEKSEALANGQVYVPKERKSSNLVLIGTVIFALGLGILIFFFLPLAISSLLNVQRDAIAFNLVAGGIRVLLFLLYVWGISQFREFRRVFQYHGAEHKSIYAYETGEELTIDNVARFSTFHPRCGTSFILIVALFAILIYSFTDSLYAVIVGVPPALAKRFLMHFLLLPLVAGGAYELLKLSGKTRDNKITKLLIQPGLWLQRITTREPSPEQMEVAIVALETALGITESKLAVKKTCL